MVKRNSWQYILFSSTKNFSTIENHIGMLPKQVILKYPANIVYYEVKVSLLSLLNCSQSPFTLPQTVVEYLRNFISVFTLEKSKKNSSVFTMLN